MRIVQNVFEKIKKTINQNIPTKGYGLAAMVEVLTGILSGAHYASNIRKWSLDGSNDAANLGQVFIAVDPNCFAPGFEDRMTDMNGILRNLPPVRANRITKPY